MGRRLVMASLLGISAWVVTPLVEIQAQEQAAEDWFDREVRPVLVEHCLKCHGDEKPKGGLRLVSRGSILEGGDSGPAAIAGKPGESLIVQAVQYHEDPKMPPKGKLGEAQIAALSRWVEVGLPWPKEAVPAAGPTRSSAGFTDEQKQFWSFQPIRKASPPSVKDSAWPRSDIDRFLLAEMDTRGLKPAAEADRRTLIRRATFDLTGLPPTPEEVEAFLHDARPDAFAHVVDRLLASPAYGERWARHWLDVVRYADSLDARGSGQPGDILDAWRYRDWVVQSLNSDLPYRDFVRQQIAGDLGLGANDSSNGGTFSREGTIATTMLAIGNWGNGDADKEKILTDIADDQVDVVSKAFLGLTVSCARCHDHKFDPIPTKDYYGLAGIFLSTHILPKLTPKGAGETIQRVALDSPQDVEARRLHAEKLVRLEASVQGEVNHAYEALALELSPRSAEHLVGLWHYATLPTDASSLGLEAFAQSRGLVPFVVRRWKELLGGGGRLLHQPVPELLSTPGVKAWAGAAEFASATANTTSKTQQILTFRLPARSISVHPGPASGVAVSWTSPITGAVRITGRVADGDHQGGDGVGWYLDHQSVAGSRELASGDLPNGGSENFPSPKNADALSTINMRAGDRLQLAILPRAEYTCDTTTVELTIVSWSGALTWDLTRDVLDDFLSGNPHADRQGNPSVWRFEDLGTKERPLGATPGEGNPIQQWQQAVEGGDPGRVTEAAKRLAESIKLTDPRSPVRISSLADEVALNPEARARLASLREELARHRNASPPVVEFANAAQDGGVPESSQAGFHDTKVHIRGRYDRLGDLVPRHFPTILGAPSDAKIASGSGRKELAEWLTRETNPLTARVMVNRIWQHHFGEGIVRTPSNFGKLGDRPSHPELLDYLAATFLETGGSIKAMHRQIMLTAAYAQDSKAPSESVRKDPENRFLSRMTRRRLEAEAIRDAMLAASGRLDPRLGGPSERALEANRRTLYLTTIRSDRATFGSLFDQADSTAPVDRRIETTVAPQSLFLLNNGFVKEQARSLAMRIRGEMPDPERAQIERAYLILFARPPTEAESTVGLQFLEQGRRKGEKPETSWESYAHVLLCTNEFVMID